MFYPSQTPEAVNRLHDLLEAILTCITRHGMPDVAHFPDDALFVVKADPRDQGRCVGKKGATIWAIQTIFWYAGFTQCYQHYRVKLLEPNQPRPGFAMPVKLTKTWSRQKIQKLLERITKTCLPDHSSFELQEQDDTTASVTFRAERYLQTAMSDPDFGEAARILIRAAGMNQGVSLATEVVFV